MTDIKDNKHKCDKDEQIIPLLVKTVWISIGNEITVIAEIERYFELFFHECTTKLKAYIVAKCNLLVPLQLLYIALLMQYKWQ